jgi:hypothetical protein
VRTRFAAEARMLDGIRVLPLEYPKDSQEEAFFTLLVAIVRRNPLPLAGI